MALATVLTGDLIGSSRAGAEAVDGAMAIIAGAAAAIGGSTGCEVRFARYRGDGWQIYSESRWQGFRMCLLILARLRCAPHLPATRISVATGETLPLGQAGLSSAGGEAFELSGRGLDALGRGEGMVYAAGDWDRGAHGWKAALFAYLDWQAARWSPEQAAAVALTVSQGGALKDQARQFGISRQALQARLKGAGHGPLVAALRSFEDPPHG